MKSISDIRAFVKINNPVTIAIAGVTREEMEIAAEAVKEKIAHFIFIGDQQEIDRLKADMPAEVSDIPVYHVDHAHDAPQKAMDLINAGTADIPMKGQVHTGTFVKAVLNKANGYFSGGRLSQITMFDGYEKGLQFLTDCAINVDLTLEVKIDIIKNAVKAAKMFIPGIPKVALLGAVETVNAKMQDTAESAVITQMNRRGQIQDCIVDGPLSLDNAISKKFADMKGIDSPVAGEADILVATSLNEANSLSKGIIHYANKEACSIIAGTAKPVIMTSRTDLHQNKLNTIAVACFMFNQ